MSDENYQLDSQINPRPIRVIQTMGENTFTDWIWFGAFAIIGFILLFVPLPVPGSISGIFTYVFKVIYGSPFFIFGALMGFTQSRSAGKLRWRVIRWMKFTISRKILSPIENDWIYQIKEVKENHLHYKSLGNEGVVSVYRLEGFDPSLLSQQQVGSIISNLTDFFGVNIKFKIVSARISYQIPEKKIANQIDHYGINFARNRYNSRIDELNKSVDLKQQAYFVVVDGPSISKNEENANLIMGSLSNAHLESRPATPEEVDQVMKEVWGNSFDYYTPGIKGFKGITYDANVIKVSKKDGTHKYMTFLSYNSIPENASVGWLGRIFNTDSFTLIMDIDPMSPEETSKYMEKIDTTADGLMQTNWFKRKARDQERMRINHVKRMATEVTHTIAEGGIGLKNVVFYLLFVDDTRKALKKRIDEFKKQLSVYNDGWTVFDCKFLQKDALIATRLHKLPPMKGGFSLSLPGKNSNKGGIYSLVNSIDHKILTTSLGLSYPFYSRTSIANDSTWFKGFQTDTASGDMDPFFCDMWKKNEQYNSFNRFYQGRNGSGKSYTADIDMVCDRLDDKFIISIDPKPERVIMTKNLGGQNVMIGTEGEDAAYINIFDVLVVPNSDQKRQNALTAQYQANLTSMSMLLSLDVNLPADKIVLSCFNDVQVYVYEHIKGITPDLDFTQVPRNSYPLMIDFYKVAIQFYHKENNPETKSAYNKLIILLKEHAIGISAPIFNNYSNIEWGKSRMWNLIVRDIALNFGNKNILACWTVNIIRIASAFLYASQRVALYIDELHLIHNIDGVLQRLDEFARVDRSFGGALCLINQNFNSIRSTSDPKKKEYYESIFTMSQYNMFFTTGEEDVDFLVQMLEGSGEPLSQTERSFVTKAGRGKALLVMNAFDRYRVQFDISFWQEIWENDLEKVAELTTEEDRKKAIESEKARSNMFPGTHDFSTPTPQPGYEDIAQTQVEIVDETYAKNPKAPVPVRKTNIPQPVPNVKLQQIQQAEQQRQLELEQFERQEFERQQQAMQAQEPTQHEEQNFQPEPVVQEQQPEEYNTNNILDISENGVESIWNATSRKTEKKGALKRKK